MSDFIIRIVLHNATATDYADLQEKFAVYGVIDTILATNEGRYKRPPAEYVYTGPESAEAVRGACVNIANSTGCACAVLVTEAKNIVWQGLVRL